MIAEHLYSVACPVCLAEPGQYCTSPAGRRTSTPHVDRQRLADQLRTEKWQ